MPTLDNAFSELRRLNQPVPKPGVLPTEEEVNRVEAELGTTFHPDFKRYLLEASDVVFGTLEPVTITSPTSHTNLLSVVESARLGSVPDKLIPVCEDNSDFYCIDESGRVCFWSHNGITEEQWPTLADWILEVWVGEA